MRISDWSSDVCSSDLTAGCDRQGARRAEGAGNPRAVGSECDSLYSFPARAARSGLDVLRCLAAVDVAEPRARLRSEARRVGKECVSTCRSRWLPDHQKKKKTKTLLQS